MKKNPFILIVIIILLIIIGILVWRDRKASDEIKTPINESVNNPINKSVEEVKKDIVEKKNVVATPVVVADLPLAKDEEALKENFNIEISLDKIVGKNWQWQKTLSYDNSVFTPKKPEAFSLTLKKDGTFTGTTDCNGIFGKYTAKDGNLKFSNIGQTLMYCENSEEVKFTSYLNQVVGYLSNQDQNLVLKLEYDSGSMIFK